MVQGHNIIIKKYQYLVALTKITVIISLIDLGNNYFIKKIATAVITLTWQSEFAWFTDKWSYLIFWFIAP